MAFKLLLQFNKEFTGACFVFVLGVDKWSTNFPACNGTRQSPINITNPTPSDIGDIEFKNYGNQNAEIFAENNGHTYSATFNGFTDSNTPEISGGGLPGTFALAGFHFHWGDTSRLGSEHYVDGVEYPAEVCLNIIFHQPDSLFHD